MSENILKTRIQLKFDTESNWNNSTIQLKAGEVAVAQVAAGTSAEGFNNVGIKVGDGLHTFSELNWLQAIAGDVYDWAKAETPEGIGHDYQLRSIMPAISGRPTGWVVSLQSKPYLSSDNWTSVTDLDLFALTGSAFGTQSAAANQVISSVGFDATNGFVVSSRALTAADIPNISAEKISSGVLGVANGGTGASSFAANEVLVGNGSAAIQTLGIDTVATQNSNHLITSGALYTALEGLSGAMKFIGKSTTPITDGGIEDPTIGGTVNTTKANGDVVVYEQQEYIWDGSAWELFGDEGSYVIKSTSVSAGDGLTGGGTLAANRTIAHAIPSGAASGQKGGETSLSILKSITTDAFGHVVGATVKLLGNAADTTVKTTIDITESRNYYSNDYVPSALAVYDALTGLNNALAEKMTYAGTVSTVSNLPQSADIGSVYYVTTTGRAYVLTGAPAWEPLVGDFAFTSSLDAIAFDGEVKNLKQTDNTILVFDCGSATTVI